jgi:hypothetical protein
MALSGDTIYVLKVEDHELQPIRVFARRDDAVEAWREVLVEALAYADDDVESLDELEGYRRGEYFSTPSGVSAEVEEVESE